MRCDPVLLVSVCSRISLFDSLNDPFTDITSHDVLYGSIPKYEGPLPPPPKICLDSLSCLTRHNIQFLSGSSGLRWAIPGTVIHSGATVAGSKPKIWLPVIKTPPSDAGYFLFRIHTCQMQHLGHGDMIAVMLKPMLTATLFSSSAILDQRRHQKFFLYRRLPMRMVDSSMLTELDVDPT